MAQYSVRSLSRKAQASLARARRRRERKAPRKLGKKRLFTERLMICIAGPGFGSGKTAGAHIIADEIRRTTGVKPLVFSTDMLGGQNPGETQTEPERLERYQTLAKKLTAHWGGEQEAPVILEGGFDRELLAQMIKHAEESDRPAIVDGTFNQPEFQKALEGPAKSHNVPFTYLVMDPGDSPQDVNERIRRASQSPDRGGSIVDESLFRQEGMQHWRGELPTGPKVHSTLSNDHTVSHAEFEKSLREKTRDIIARHTAVPLDKGRIQRKITAIDQMPISAEEKFGHLLSHLQQHYGFNRNGSVSILFPSRNPETGTVDRLDFMHAIDPPSGKGANVLPELKREPARLDGRNNTSNTYLAGQPRRIMYFTPSKTDQRAHRRLRKGPGALADAFYIPSGDLGHPAARYAMGLTPMPGRHAGIFTFYSTERRTTNAFADLINVLKIGEPTLRKWWTQFHHERDHTPKKIAGLRDKIDGIESQNPYGRGHSFRVRLLAEKVGRRMGIIGASRTDLLAAAHLNEVGKLSIASQVTQMQDPLSDESQRIIQGQVRHAGQLLPELSADGNLVSAILERHLGPHVLDSVDLNGEHRRMFHLGQFEPEKPSDRTRIVTDPDMYARQVQQAVQRAYQDDETYTRFFHRRIPKGTVDDEQFHGLGHGVYRLEARPLSLAESGLFSRIIDGVKLVDRLVTRRKQPISPYPDAPARTHHGLSDLRQTIRQAARQGHLDPRVASILAGFSNGFYRQFYKKHYRDPTTGQAGLPASESTEA